MHRPWRPAETVPAQFRAADPSVRRSFVAALWAARGWETRVDGERVRAQNHSNWGDLTLWVPSGRSTPRAAPPGVDAVVTAGSSPVASSVRTITPVDLERMALYAGDRTAAEDACRRLLDVELRSVSDPTPSGAPLAEIALVAVAAVVVLAAVFGVVGTTPDASTPADDDDATLTESPDRRSLAPGVTEDGLQDPAALASAHAQAVERHRPYVWRLTYEEYNASERSPPLVSHNETVWVVDDNRYRVDKDILYGSSAPEVGPLIVSNRAYADGEHRYVRYRLGGHAEFERFPVTVDDVGAERYSTRSAELLTVFLDTNDSWIRRVEINGRPYLQLYGSGSTRFGSDRYRVVAFFTDEGFVRELSVTFHQPKTDTAVIFTYEYRPLSGTLTPPPWAGGENVTVGETDRSNGPPPRPVTRTATPSGTVDTIAPPDATVPNGSVTASNATATPSG